MHCYEAVDLDALVRVSVIFVHSSQATDKMSSLIIITTSYQTNLNFLLQLYTMLAMLTSSPTFLSVHMVGVLVYAYRLPEFL